MQKNRNCPNCGAPYDIHLNTCPYCNTSYFDMSAIDISSTEPFYLKLRMGESTFTSKVCVTTADIAVRTNYASASSDGVIISKFAESKDVDINLNFTSCCNGGGNQEIYSIFVE